MSRAFTRIGLVRKVYKPPQGLYVGQPQDVVSPSIGIRFAEIFMAPSSFSNGLSANAEDQEDSDPSIEVRTLYRARLVINTHNTRNAYAAGDRPVHCIARTFINLK